MKRKILTKNFDSTSNDVECGMFSIIYTNWLFEKHYIIFKDLFDGDMNWFPPRFIKWIKMWISMPHETVCDLQKIADANKISLKHFAKNQCHCMMTLTKKLHKEFLLQKKDFERNAIAKPMEDFDFFEDSVFLDIVKKADRANVEKSLPLLSDAIKMRYIQALSRIYGMASVLSNLSVLDW